jgi:hypothetical protein
MVNQMQPVKTTKKPVRFDLEAKASPPSPEIKNKMPKKEQLTHGGPSAPSEHGPTRTHPIPPGNESPLPPRVRRHHSSSWLSDLPIPPPPEDEPLPPTKVVKGFRGNRYTAEDKKYFSKYVSWALEMILLSRRVKLLPNLQKRYVDSEFRWLGSMCEPCIGTTPYSQFLGFLLGPGSYSRKGSGGGPGKSDRRSGIYQERRKRGDRGR